MIARHQYEDIHNWFLRLHAHAHTHIEVCVLAVSEKASARAQKQQTVSIIPGLWLPQSGAYPRADQPRSPSAKGASPRGLAFLFIVLWRAGRASPLPKGKGRRHITRLGIPASLPLNGCFLATTVGGCRPRKLDPTQPNCPSGPTGPTGPPRGVGPDLDWANGSA